MTPGHPTDGIGRTVPGPTYTPPDLALSVLIVLGCAEDEEFISGRRYARSSIRSLIGWKWVGAPRAPDGTENIEAVAPTQTPIPEAGYKHLGAVVFPYAAALLCRDAVCLNGEALRLSPLWTGFIVPCQTVSDGGVIHGDHRGWLVDGGTLRLPQDSEVIYLGPTSPRSDFIVDEIRHRRTFFQDKMSWGICHLPSSDDEWVQCGTLSAGISGVSHHTQLLIRNLGFKNLLHHSATMPRHTVLGCAEDEEFISGLLYGILFIRSEIEWKWVGALCAPDNARSEARSPTQPSIPLSGYKHLGALVFHYAATPLCRDAVGRDLYGSQVQRVCCRISRHHGLDEEFISGLLYGILFIRSEIEWKWVWCWGLESNARQHHTRPTIAATGYKHLGALVFPYAAAPLCRDASGEVMLSG